MPLIVKFYNITENVPGCKTTSWYSKAALCYVDLHLGHRRASLTLGQLQPAPPHLASVLKPDIWCWRTSPSRCLLQNQLLSLWGNRKKNIFIIYWVHNVIIFFFHPLFPSFLCAFFKEYFNLKMIICILLGHSVLPGIHEEIFSHNSTVNEELKNSENPWQIEVNGGKVKQQ